MQNCGEGDEVITVSNTAVPTVSAIVSTGAVPRFVDIDPQTYLMDTTRIERVTNEKTKCILPVHLYGQCVDIDRLLADTDLILPSTMAGNEHAYYLYVCRHPQRDRIIEELKKRDILVNISYPWPIHTMTGYRSFGYNEGDFPHTEKAAREIFSLPLYPSLTDDEQEQVISVLYDILK